jgi:hypothetical protein
MHHRLSRMFCLVLFSLLSTAVFAQEDFSAEIVRSSKGEQRSEGKIYVSKDKMRFESEGGNDRNAVAIVNFATRTNRVLMPAQKMYIEMPGGMGPAAQRTRYFFRADPDNACSDWLKAANKPGGECHKVGSAVVNGRDTVEYEAKSEQGKGGHVWLDRKINFPVKWDNNDGGEGELRNIKEGSQPAALFEVPSDYQKMDMGNMGMPGAARPH